MKNVYNINKQYKKCYIVDKTIFKNKLIIVIS